MARQICRDPNKVSVEAWATSMPRRSHRGGALAGTPRGSRYPPTLQTSLQIVIRPITGPHINRDPNEGQEDGKTPVCAAYCEHWITCCKDNASHSNGVENLFRLTGGQGCRKYDTRAPAGHSSPDHEGGFCRVLCAADSSGRSVKDGIWRGENGSSAGWRFHGIRMGNTASMQ